MTGGDSGSEGVGNTGANPAAHLSAHGTLTVRAALASVSMAIVLLALKGWGAWHTGSSAMLGSLADTGLDLLASIVTLVGVRVAAMPADDNHRFGHGKAEALVALVQVIIISMSALGIGAQAIVRLLHGGAVTDAPLGISVSAVAIVLTTGLLAYQQRVIDRTGSVAISADNLHYKSDLILNFAVILALVIEQYLHLRGADAVFGILIAGWLLWGAWRTTNQVLGQLMDLEWPQERKLAFIEVAMRHPEARGIHDLRTRSSGAHQFVQFHLWVRPEMTVAEAHRIMDRIEADLMIAFPGVEVLIHPDPDGHSDELGYVPSETLTTSEGA